MYTLSGEFFPDKAKQTVCKLITTTSIDCWLSHQGYPGAKGEVGDPGAAGKDGMIGPPGLPGPPVSFVDWHFNPLVLRQFISLCKLETVKTSWRTTELVTVFIPLIHVLYRGL